MCKLTTLLNKNKAFNLKLLFLNGPKWNFNSTFSQHTFKTLETICNCQSPLTWCISTYAQNNKPVNVCLLSDARPNNLILRSRK